MELCLSLRYETLRSGVLSLADEEEEGEGDVMVEENLKNSLDVVNRKTQERVRQVRVIGEEEGKGLKMDVDVDVRG